MLNRFIQLVQTKNFLLCTSYWSRLCNVPQHAAIRTYNGFCKNCNFKRRLQLRLGRDSTTIPLRNHVFSKKGHVSSLQWPRPYVTRIIHHYPATTVGQYCFLGAAYVVLSVCGSDRENCRSNYFNKDHKKLSCRRETARRFVSLNILLSHSRSLKLILNDKIE